MQTIPKLIESATSALEGTVPSSVSTARWIWSDDDPDMTNVWVYARRRFEAQSTVGSYLNISADLRYVAWINGHRVGFGPPKSHITQPTLDRWCIDKYLHAGDNILVVFVYSLGNVDNISSVMPRRGAILASIQVDGKIIITDQQWKVRREHAYRPCALRRGDVQPHNEVFDDRLSLGEPWQCDYDDSDWPCATELSTGPLMEPYTAIEPRDLPLISWQTNTPERIVEFGEAKYSSVLNTESIVTAAEQIAAASRYPDADNRIAIDHQSHTVSFDAHDLDDHDGLYMRWDLGKIWTGYPVVEIQGDPGTIIDLSYGEHLPQGRIDPTKTNLQYFDRIILGEKVCHHRIMWPKCFRYIQADVRGGGATIHSISLEQSTYPVKLHGGFHSSDATLDQAWQLGTHTLQLCMEDSYMDTPWRERGAWLGDTMVNIKGNYYAFGDTALARRLLRLHVFGQNADGSMNCKHPGRCSSHIHTWSLSYPIILLDYLTYSGDEEFVKELWPTCDRIIDWLESYRGKDGLYAGFPLKVTPHENFYTFIDWSPVDMSGANAAFHAYAFAFLNACEKLASVAGDVARQSFCSLRSHELKQQFQNNFWDTKRGVFVNGCKDGSQLKRWGCQENYLALAMGLATDEQRQSIIQRLMEEDLTATFTPRDDEHNEKLATMAIALNTYSWDDRKMVPLGTPYFAYWAMVSLFEVGMGAQALELIRVHWGNYSKQGATTTWENWDMQASLSHAWGVGPAVVLGKYILGVDWTDSDPDHFEVLPQRIDLTQAKGRVPLRRGVVDISWTWDDHWVLKVLVPKKCTAIVGLPHKDASGIRLNGQPVTSPISVKRGEVVFLAAKVNAGLYTLEHADLI